MRFLTKKSVLYSESCNKEYTHIVADDTSLGALQPSKASPHRPRHWNISMGILIVQASVMDDNIDTKIRMLQLENTKDKHSGKYWRML